MGQCQEDIRSARDCKRRLDKGLLSGRHLLFDNGQDASVGRFMQQFFLAADATTRHSTAEKMREQTELEEVRDLETRNTFSYSMTNGHTLALTRKY